MNKKTRSRATFIFLTALSAAGARAEIGLGARFGDVLIEGVEPGRTYNLREAAHVPFGIENKGDAETDIVIEFEAPSMTYVSKEYEPIPDPSWFKAIPPRMKIGPKSIGFFDLLLTVPEDKALVGRHFQAMVKARMDSKEMLALAIDNRVRFSVGPGPESIKEEKKKKAMTQLDFDVSPQSLYVREVPVGKKFDVRKEQKKSIRVANYASDPLSIVMTVEPWDAQANLPAGYERMPDTSWVKLKPSTVVVEGSEIGQAFLTLEVPDDAKYKGKKYAAMIRSGLAAGFWLDAPVKLMIETNP